MKKFYFLLILIISQGRFLFAQQPYTPLPPYISSPQVYTIGTSNIAALGTGAATNYPGLNYTNNGNPGFTVSGKWASFPCPYFARAGKVVRNQFLVRASELIAAGAPAGGGAITSVAFNLAAPNALAPITNKGFTVSIGQTAATSLAGFVGGLTSVYSQDYIPANTYVPGGQLDSWQIHLFNTCFEWDGTSSIIIETCETGVTGGAFIGAMTYWTPGLGFNASVYDSTAVCGASANPLLSNRRPNMQFNIIPGVDGYVASITTPATSINQNSTFSVNMNIGNATCNGNITSATLGYSWNGGAPVNVAWTGTITPFTTIPYTFTNVETASAAGVNVLKTWIKNTNGIDPDGNSNDDTLTTIIYVQPTSSTFDPLGYYGTDFWLAYMQNYTDKPRGKVKLNLYFAGGNAPATVTVYAPALQAAALSTISVPANTVQFDSIPLIVQNDTMTTSIKTGETVDKTGIHITSSTPISVYGIDHTPSSSDGFLAIPTPALSTTYVTVAQEGTVGGGGPDAVAEFVVVGTQNATNVTISTLKATKSHAANTPWTVTLNTGETYLVSSKVTITGTANGDTSSIDLTGSLITSNNPVAVFGGTSCADMPGDHVPGGGCGNCNFLDEEMPPYTAWGKTYYCGDFALKTNHDLLRIISNYSGTTHVWANGVAVTNAYAGAYPAPSAGGLVGLTYTEIPLPDNTGMEITADQPIYVVQESVGGVCDNTSSDPMYINMIPEEQWGQYYSFSTPTNLFNPPFGISFINVIKNGTGTLVTLDGVEISPALFSQIGTTGYYYTKYPVSQGYHLVVGTQPFMVYVYGFAAADAYGWAAAGASVHTTTILSTSLLNFNGTRQSNNTNLLKWTTAGEINNDHFSIERSANGYDYSTLHNAKGTGNSSVQQNYSYIDKTPADGINYYRLKQVDFNGKNAYSNAVSINNQINNFTVNISPSPVSDILKIALNVENSGTMYVQIVDVFGNMRINRINQANVGNNDMSIDVSSLPAGIYIVSVSQNDERVLKKIVKY